MLRFGAYAIRVLSCTCKRLCRSIRVEERRIATRPFRQLVVYDLRNPYVVHVASRAWPSVRPSRAMVVGRRRGRPPDSSYSAEELQAKREGREQELREKAKRLQLECERANAARAADDAARVAAEDAHARARGFADGLAYRAALHAPLPCGHGRANWPNKGSADAGVCAICHIAYGELRAEDAPAPPPPAPRPRAVNPPASAWLTCACCQRSACPGGTAYGWRDPEDGQYYCKWCWEAWDAEAAGGEESDGCAGDECPYDV